MVNPVRITPIKPQIRYRATFAPPNYSLIKQDVSIGIATKITEMFNLRSSSLIFNQNTLSAQYLSFRYIYPNEPMRYFDASIGVDQAECLFSSPANVAELKDGIIKVWESLFEKSKAIATENYFEATFHSVIAKDSSNLNNYFDDFVKIETERTDLSKGFSLTIKHPELMCEARLGIEPSNALTNGIYLAFAAISKKKVKDVNSLTSLFDNIISVYRDIQSLAQIEVAEP